MEEEKLPAVLELQFEWMIDKSSTVRRNARYNIQNLIRTKRQHNVALERLCKIGKEIKMKRDSSFFARAIYCYDEIYADVMQAITDVMDQEKWRHRELPDE